MMSKIQICFDSGITTEMLIEDLEGLILVGIDCKTVFVTDQGYEDLKKEIGVDFDYIEGPKGRIRVKKIKVIE